MLETSARLLRLLAILQSNREWSGPELAERLEVSARTVRKDIDRLRQLGYPVDATRGVTGGYRLGVGATMPPLLLDDEEAVAIAVSMRQATRSGVTGIEEASLRALTKLEQVLPPRLRQRVQALRTVASTVPSTDKRDPVDPQTLTTLAGASRNHEAVRMRYTRHDGTGSSRIVEPHHLVNWGHRWYLVAWDRERGAWRTFRVDRIASATATGLLFRPRDLPGEDISEYIARTVAQAGWKVRASIVIAAPAEDVLAFINPAYGTVEPLAADACLFRTGADGLWEIAVHLGVMPWEFRVLEPPDLRDFLRQAGERSLRASST